MMFSVVLRGKCKWIYAFSRA